MNNVQSSSSVSAKTSSIEMPLPETVQVDKQSPDELKRQIETGELKEGDFPNQEAFEKFVAFLAGMLNTQINIAKQHAPALTDAKVQQVIKNAEALQNKTANAPSKEQAKPELNQLLEKAKALVENAPKQAELTVQNQSQVMAKSEEKELPKEMVSLFSNAKHLSVNPEVVAPTTAQQTTVDLFKAENAEKLAIGKEHALQISDKMVTLHTAGGNNLSMLGSDVSASGDIQFVNESRDFAEGEGYREQHQQQQQQQDEMDVEQAYFTKDREQ